MKFGCSRRLCGYSAIFSRRGEYLPMELDNNITNVIAFSSIRLNFSLTLMKLASDRILSYANCWSSNNVSQFGGRVPGPFLRIDPETFPIAHCVTLLRATLFQPTRSQLH